MQSDKTFRPLQGAKIGAWQRLLRVFDASNQEVETTSTVSKLYSLSPCSDVIQTYANPTPLSVAFTQAPKSLEATRQIQRIFTAKRDIEGLEEGASDDSLIDENVRHAIELINCFVVSPLDIPTASIDDEGRPSLFVFDNNVYLDLTVDGNKADYYLRLKTGEHSSETFDQETIDGKFIPPRLLGRLVSVIKNK